MLYYVLQISAFVFHIIVLVLFSCSWGVAAVDSLVPKIAQIRFTLVWDLLKLGHIDLILVKPMLMCI